MLPRRAALLALVALVACGGGGRKEKPPAASAPAAGAPAGWELVFEREVDGAMDLFVVPAGGGQERRLTRHHATDGLARWAPDGKRILFTSDRTGLPQIWEVAAEGGEPRRVRANGATEYQADVSPDGKLLAFLSNLDGPERLLVQDLASGAVRELVRHGEDTIFGNPHWSPDGRFITYSSNHRLGHQIYVVEVATGKERRISGLTGGGCEPRFSRDGRKVVYVSRGHMRPTSRLVEHDLATRGGAGARLVAGHELRPRVLPGRHRARLRLEHHGRVRDLPPADLRRAGLEGHLRPRGRALPRLSPGCCGGYRGAASPPAGKPVALGSVRFGQAGE